MNQQAMEEQSVRISKNLDAPVARVFAAWTDASQVAQWFGPPGYTVRIPRLEPEVDGGFQFEMIPPDGSSSRFIVGRYLECNPLERLVFTWAWQDDLEDESTRGPDSLVTVEFNGDDKRTVLALTHERLPGTEAAAAHRQGWEGSLHCLQEFLS